MANKQIVFADRVVGLSVQNGLVRMDVAVIAGTGKGKDGKPALKMEATHQIVMPVDGFLAAVNMQGKLVNEMATRAKKRRETKGGAAAEAPAETPAAG